MKLLKECMMSDRKKSVINKENLRTRKYRRDKYSKSNINNVSGNVFNGPTNIVAGDNYSKKDEEDKVATYTPEPIWRSPITMAILSWVGLILSLIELFPLYKIFEPIISLMTNKRIKTDLNNNIYVIIFAVIFIFFVLTMCLRSITKKETRHPLFFDYAISGLGRRITIEKIHIDKCPICGGTMKYFNKAVEWEDRKYSDGGTKREVIKKVPALQCKRNSNHWFEVDPAEDRVNKIGD